ncbi:MAG: MarR family winged helix-turn-helix transcriptional regulator [Sulfuricurvum sp.]|uniref:MarR family winged helix-turn-helix transcriptional regulator n=1 Tax=Sulfuricurvum sp. TaxID=2025608 RepID=UPI00261EDF19|nr:MarR family transcriptional regulator [Sulfuricurvum sp.]MDD4884648.1 MarR family transcriptional regulator [Sulfuricurvum sp.]
MKKLPQFDENIALSLSTWVELMKAFSKIRSLEMELIEANGLTIGQFSLLELLYHRGSQSVGAATTLAMSTPGNMTVVVKNLAKQGMIVVDKDPKDKRISTLSISEKGSELMKNLFPEHAKRIDRFLSGLDNDDKEAVKKLLRKLNKSLK